MKRTLCLLLCLCLCLCTGVALGAQYTAGGLFTITYDDQLLLDDTAYLAENTDDHRWLFLLTDRTWLVDVSVEIIEGYEGFSLHEAAPDERELYLMDVLDSMSDYKAESLGWIYAGDVPFLLIKLYDDEGGYLMAETVAGGCAIDFMIYYGDLETEADAALEQVLRDVVSTFVPVV